MLLLILAIIAISTGLVLVLADDRVGKRAARGPEAGAAMARMLGMILLIGGGLAFLSWTR